MKRGIYYIDFTNEIVEITNISRCGYAHVYDGTSVIVVKKSLFKLFLGKNKSVYLGLR